MNRRGFLIGLIGGPVVLSATAATSQLLASELLALDPSTRRLTLEEALANPTAAGQPAVDYVYRMRRYRRGGRTGGFWRNAVLRARRRRGR